MNLIEKSVLEMEVDESSQISEKLIIENGLTKENHTKLVQQIRVLSMQLQRYKPTEWNEFLDVALDH